MAQVHHRQVRVALLDGAAEVAGVRVRQVQHGEHQVVLSAGQRGQGGIDRRHPGDARRVAQVEAAVFVDDALGQPAVLLHDPGIVRRRNEQHVPHLAGHELVEDLELRIEVLRKAFDGKRHAGYPFGATNTNL